MGLTLHNLICLSYYPNLYWRRSAGSGILGDLGSWGVKSGNESVGNGSMVVWICYLDLNEWCLSVVFLMADEKDEFILLPR